MRAPDSVPTFLFRGQPALRMTTKDGAEAIISLFGAQVLSWTPAGGAERLYLSERAVFDHTTPIRGGIPICFPQFSDTGPLPRHGLLRTRVWTLVDFQTIHNSHFALAVLRCTDDEASRAVWPHAFTAELSIMIENQRIDLEFETINTGTTPFTFTAALHSYIRVKEVEETRLEGLYGMKYRNLAAGDTAIHRDSGDVLMVDNEVDRVYYNLSHPLLLKEPRRSLGIHSEHFRDTVIWNPWETRCAALADMQPSDFRRFLCVESAAIAHPITMQPQEHWWGRQTLLAL